jgi:hypothetical protein
MHKRILMDIDVHTGSARVHEMWLTFSAEDTDEEKSVIATLAKLPHITMRGTQLRINPKETTLTHVAFESEVLNDESPST